MEHYAQIIDVEELRRRRDCRSDWSNQDIAELYRVKAALDRLGIPIGTDRGLTDEGEPWFVFYRLDTGDVIIHFARTDGSYIAANTFLENPLKSGDFRGLVEAFVERCRPAQMMTTMSSSGLYVHPASALVVLVMALYAMSEMSHGAVTSITSGPAGAEAAGGDETIARPSLAELVRNALVSHNQATMGRVDVPHVQNDATHSMTLAAALTVAVGVVSTDQIADRADLTLLAGDRTEIEGKRIDSAADIAQTKLDAEDLIEETLHVNVDRPGVARGDDLAFDRADIAALIRDVDGTGAQLYFDFDFEALFSRAHHDVEQGIFLLRRAPEPNLSVQKDTVVPSQTSAESDGEPMAATAVQPVVSLAVSGANFLSVNSVAINSAGVASVPAVTPAADLIDGYLSDAIGLSNWADYLVEDAAKVGAEITGLLIGDTDFSDANPFGDDVPTALAVVTEPAIIMAGADTSIGESGPQGGGADSSSNDTAAIAALTDVAETSLVLSTAAPISNSGRQFTEAETLEVIQLFIESAGGFSILFQGDQIFFVDDAIFQQPEAVAYETFEVDSSDYTIVLIGVEQSVDAVDLLLV